MLNKGPLWFEMTRELEDNETIQGQDWIEWTHGAWTRISEESVFVGLTPPHTQPGLKFRRDVPNNPK